MTLCKIYRSGRKAETYLYLRHDLDFSDLPGELQASFGEPAFVMQLALTPARKLSRVDTARVIQALEDPGFFLQLPPELPVEEEISRRFG